MNKNLPLLFIRIIGGIDFDDNLGFINDPRIFGAQFSGKF